MFPQMQTTPIAGSRLTSHIRALLLMFSTYRPPPSSLSAAISVPAANRATRVPPEVLTDTIVEEIKTRCCFVGDVLAPGKDTRREDTPSEEDPESEMDLPPSSDVSVSESDFSHAMSQPDSGPSVVATGSAFGMASHHAPGGENHLQAIASMYKRYSTATDIQMRVTPPPSQQSGTGQGTLIIPGWIRERSAEVLFEGGDVDESSLAELILDALLKV
jgi:actin-related protein 10